MPRTAAQGIAFLLGLAFVLWLSPLVVHVSNAENDPSAFSALEAALHAQVNGLRTSKTLIPLERRPELDRVALEHSRDMARRGYIAHESPEGLNPLQRIQGAGIAGFTLAAENIGRTGPISDPSREITNAWLVSPLHRENLLAPPFNATGIGVARAPDGALLYTQIYVSWPR